MSRDPDSGSGNEMLFAFGIKQSAYPHGSFVEENSGTSGYMACSSNCIVLPFTFCDVATLNQKINYE